MSIALKHNTLSNWKVVVIDDDPASLEIAATLLANFGAEVFEAIDGEEGLERIRSIRPRFVVCDLDMPRIDGWEVIQALKDDRELADIPVVALTAHSMIGDRQKAIAAGFHNYLTKPLTPSTFLNDLLRLLSDAPTLADEIKPLL